MGIRCPGGTKVLPSTKSARCYGIFQDSERICAKTEAEGKVLDDLKDQINDAECDGDCFKKEINRTQMTTRTACKRVWWTFWIMVRCEATATQSITIECVIEG